jgi:hypothetical protein
MGVLGEAVCAYFKIPPYLDVPVGVAEVGATVVGLVTGGVVVAEVGLAVVIAD